MPLSRVLFVFFLVSAGFIGGCGDSGGTKVLQGEAIKDPSLGSDYTGETGGDPNAKEPKR